MVNTGISLQFKFGTVYRFASAIDAIILFIQQLHLKYAVTSFGNGI